MANHPVECPGCKRVTRRNRRGECIYCAAPLPEPKAFEEPRELGSKLGFKSKSRFTSQTDSRGHYLTPEVGEPVRFDQGKLFVLGRDSHASMVVHSPSVSRQHAEIDWEGNPPRPVLRELRSSEGTYLNDKLVEQSAPLRSGDEIRLGPRFTLHYFYLTERDLVNLFKERGRETTRRITAAKVQKVKAEVEAASAAETAGNKPIPPWASFGSFSPQRVLEWFVQASSTGILTFYTGSHTGEIYLRHGRQEHVVFRELRGSAAIDYFMRAPSIAYRFHEGGGQPPDPNVSVVPIEGALEGNTCRELIDCIQEAKSSGVLTVFDKESSGSATFIQGSYTSVSFGDLLGKYALPLILRLTAGSYRYRPIGGPKPPASRRASRPALPTRTGRVPPRDTGPRQRPARQSGSTKRPARESGPRSATGSKRAPSAGRSSGSRRRPPPPPPAD